MCFLLSVVMDGVRRERRSELPAVSADLPDGLPRRRPHQTHRLALGEQQDLTLFPPGTDIRPILFYLGFIYNWCDEAACFFIWNWPSIAAVFRGHTSSFKGLFSQIVESNQQYSSYRTSSTLVIFVRNDLRLCPEI